MTAETPIALQERLATLRIADPIRYRSLTIFPLVWPEQAEPPYAILAKAIENGTAAVRELNRKGSVPQLRIVNKALRPILIVEGEILIGAKQNRVVNLTALVAAKSSFTLPVSCVEAGRWHYDTTTFASAACAPPSLRQKKLRSVQANRQFSGEACSDQSEIWETIRSNLADVQVHSETQSLTDGLAWCQQQIAADRESLQLPAEAAGVIVGRGDRIVGIDLFDSPATLAVFWPRLSDAYCFDALRQEAGQPETPRDRAAEFLAALGQHAKPRAESLGLGDEWEIQQNELVGSALVYADKLCHLAAFPS